MGKCDFLLAIDAWESVQFFFFFHLFHALLWDLRKSRACLCISCSTFSLYEPVVGEELGLGDKTKN